MISERHPSRCHHRLLLLECRRRRILARLRAVVFESHPLHPRHSARGATSRRAPASGQTAGPSRRGVFIGEGRCASLFTPDTYRGATAKTAWIAHGCWPVGMRRRFDRGVETEVENGLHMAVPVDVLVLFCLLLSGRIDALCVYAAY